MRCLVRSTTDITFLDNSQKILLPHFDRLTLLEAWLYETNRAGWCLWRARFRFSDSTPSRNIGLGTDFCIASHFSFFLKALMLMLDFHSDLNPVDKSTMPCWWGLKRRKQLSMLAWYLPGRACVRTVMAPGGVLPYMGYIVMCRCEGYGFQAVYSSIGYINQSVWVLNRLSFVTKLTSCLKILSRLRKPGIYSSIG